MTATEDTDPANEVPEGDTPAYDGMTRNLALGLVAALVAVAALFGAGWLGHQLGGGSHPGNDSAEAGFSRDMQVHHMQAVEMATIMYGKTDDPELKAVAYDILTTQQHQIGQMHEWLQMWGLPQTGDEEHMEWMTRVEGHEHGGGSSEGMLLDDGRMPGMASPEQLTALREATGVEAEVLFLELMIEHHKAAIPMAEAVLAASDVPVVVNLAEAIITSQKSEIELMQAMLQRRA